MRQISFALSLFAIAVFSGCSGESSNDNADSSPDSSASNLSDSEASAMAPSAVASQTDASPSEDLGDWLPLPAEATPQIQQVYPSFARAASDGDTTALANLSIISQEIASGLADSGQENSGYEFFKQSARALRLALDGGVEGLPTDMPQGVFAMEAIAHAKSSSVDEAFSAIDDAIKHGFLHLDQLLGLPELALLRASDKLDDRRAGWEKVINDKLIADGLSELASGETFPFSFSANDIYGIEQSTDALTGKVVLVDIWGTWCPPCRAEIPSFIKLQERYGESGLQILGVNYERGPTPEANMKSVVQFVQSNGINYPCIMGPPEIKNQIPDFGSFPTTVLIDKTGKVRMKAVGTREFAALDAIISTLLAE